MSVEEKPPVSEKQSPENIERPVPKLAIVARNATPTAPAWPPRFIRGSKGTGPIQKVIANALRALRAHKAWEGVLRYDAMALRVEIAAPPPWEKAVQNEWLARPWNDHDDSLCTEWLQSEAGVLVGTPIAAQAVQTVAKEHTFHPVRAYLSRLRWDGTPRLVTWLADYMGADPSEYASVVGTRWMVSAIARVMQPGCKVDCMPVFEGIQGQGKSTVLRRLAEPWFTDMIKDLQSKDTALSIAGKWIVEFQELEGFKGSTVEQLKAFLSRNEDRFRPPYGRSVIDSPRQCVFVGTTNQQQYLQDETGNRRFWPVTCQRGVRPDQLALVRDQLWAEAATLFENEHSWWLDTPELRALAAVEQEARFVPDSWEEDVNEYVAKLDEVTISELLEIIAEIKPSKATQQDQKRMGKIMARLGWKRRRERIGEGKRAYVFKRPALS